jgi:zinc protease
VYGEYRKNRANPFFQLFEKVSETAFTKHTYGHTTMGFERDISNMPKMLDYSKAFFGRYYRPDNALLLIVGDVPVEPAQTAERKVEITYEGRALPVLSLSYKAGAMAPRDVSWVSQLVLSEVAFGTTSELYKTLVLEKQLVQRVMASPATDRDPSLFSITAVVNDAAKLDEVQRAMEAAIERAKTVAADPKRVAEVVANLRNEFLLKLTTPSAVADELAPFIATAGSIAAIDDLYTTLAKVTPQTVRTAAIKLFDTRRRTVATLREKK